MGTFEYITALVSVVVGLAIADMMTSLHRLLRNRRRVRWDWVAPLAALVILVELFNLWWSWRGFKGDSLADLAPYFLALVLLFLTASATLPDEVPEQGVDWAGTSTRIAAISGPCTVPTSRPGSECGASATLPRERALAICCGDIILTIRGSSFASAWCSSAGDGSAASFSSSPLHGSFTASAGRTSR